MSLSCGATEFSPASLFTSGVVGAWYDPSDYSTLFQDSAGTTPVTAVEQPVGLMLDKSQGLVLGSEVVISPLSTSGVGWSVVSNTFVATSSTATGVVSTTGTLATTKRYQISFTASALSGGTCFVQNDSSVAALSKRIASAGNYTFILLGSGSSALQFQPYEGTAFSVTLSNISVKEIAGNHALQATSASRPILRARYNLLTYSEQFDNGAYTKSSVTLTTNATTAPDGTTTAEKVLATFGNARHAVYPSGVTASGTCVASVYVKYDNHAFFQIAGSSGGFYANFNILTGVVGTSGGARYISHAITNVGSGWYRLSVTYTNSGDGPWLQQASSASDGLLPFWTAAGTESTFIWGAQVDNASSIGTYQRIAAATDYATAGFLPYLYFVTDDSFGTNSIDFTATDKMSVCAGLTKLSDSSIGTVIESSAAAGANNGTFAIYAPNSPNQYTARSAGTATGDVNITSGYAAPITNVLTMLGDISGDSNKLRINGTQVGQSIVDQGTGNYLSYPLYIGRRNNSSFPFEGRIYQMVVCGKTLSASELASTEAYVNQKTGAY
jgi:hypothetical protein